jgi:hypothetical protein
MFERFLTIIAVLATVSVISVPAQQAVTTDAGRFARTGARVLAGATPSVFTTVEGSVVKADSRRFAGALVRLREARIGRIVLTQQADADGLFRFRPVDRGSYIVELLADEKTVLAASPLVNVNAGEIAQTVVREPVQTDPGGMASFADAHAEAVQAAAATAGILAKTRGDDVSPR